MDIRALARDLGCEIYALVSGFLSIGREGEGRCEVLRGEGRGGRGDRWEIEADANAGGIGPEEPWRFPA